MVQCSGSAVHWAVQSVQWQCTSLGSPVGALIALALIALIPLPKTNKPFRLIRGEDMNEHYNNIIIFLGSQTNGNLLLFSKTLNALLGYWLLLAVLLAVLLPPLVYLYVGLGEGDHLGEDLGHVQVIHLEPLPRAGVQDMDPVVPFLRTAVMDDIGDQIVGGSIVVPVLHVSREQVSKLDVTQRKVDNRRVFFNKKVVFGETLDVENNVPTNNRYLELSNF